MGYRSRGGAFEVRVIMVQWYLFVLGYLSGVKRFRCTGSICIVWLHAHPYNSKLSIILWRCPLLGVSVKRGSTIYRLAGAHKRKERSTPIARVVISKRKLRRLRVQKTSLYGSFFACGHQPTGSFYVMNSFSPAAYKEGCGLVARKTAANRSLLLVSSMIK